MDQHISYQTDSNEKGHMFKQHHKHSFTFCENYYFSITEIKTKYNL